MSFKANITWIGPKPTRSFIPKVRLAASRHALNIAKAVWVGVVDRTHVDSGELRASWNLSARKPNYTTVGPSDSATLLATPLPKPTLPIIRPTILRNARYYVTNGKTYARSEEFGSPTNTPVLMLTRAVQSVEL